MESGKYRAPEEADKKFESARTSGLFRNATFVLRRIEKITCEWPQAIHLEDRLGVGPGEMVNTGGNHGQVGGVNYLRGGVRVKFVADSDVKWPARNNGNVFIDGVGMRRNAVVSSIFESYAEFAGLRWIAVQAKHFASSGHAGAVEPLGGIVGEDCGRFCFLRAHDYDGADSNGKKQSCCQQREIVKCLHGRSLLERVEYDTAALYYVNGFHPSNKTK